MIGFMTCVHVPGQSRRRAIGVLIAAGVFAASIMTIGWLGGYRINMTPSEPLGLWRILRLDRPPEVGDIVFICPPERIEMQQARERGYLRRGLCAGGVAPLIKAIVGVPRQHVKIGASVTIDGRELAGSRLAPSDGRGRILTPSKSGVIPPGSVFLHSSFSASWDSRYFGPIPASGILGLAQKVLIYAP